MLFAALSAEVKVMLDGWGSCPHAVLQLATFSALGIGIIQRREWARVMLIIVLCVSDAIFVLSLIAAINSKASVTGVFYYFLVFSIVHTGIIIFLLHPKTRRYFGTNVCTEKEGKNGRP